MIWIEQGTHEHTTLQANIQRSKRSQPDETCIPSKWRKMPKIKHASFALFDADVTGSVDDTVCKGHSRATAEETLQVVHVLYTAFKVLWQQYAYPKAGPQRLMCGGMPVLEMKGAGVSDAGIASRELLLKTVKELEDNNIKVVAVDILQNMKNWCDHVQWCLYEEIALEDWVTMYHGTDEQALDSIIVHGVAGRYTKRRACGSFPRKNAELKEKFGTKLFR